MASCTLGAPNVKFVKLESGKAVAGLSLYQYHKQVWMGQKSKQFAGLVMSPCTKKSVIVHCDPSSETEVVAAEDTKDGLRETESSEVVSQLVPNASEVESLLKDICDTTSIAEFELKLGGFHLHLTRDLTSKVTPQPPPPPVATTAPPAPTPASENKAAEAPAANGSVSTLSLALSRPIPSPHSVKSLLDIAADEGLVIVESPRVGLFRRSLTIKGKRLPPACNEDQIVKEGQAVCYVEQFGSSLPVEANVAGEVVKILREDGEAVGYGDALIAILPSFPGIKLQ